MVAGIGEWMKTLKPGDRGAGGGGHLAATYVNAGWFGVVAPTLVTQFGS